MRDGARSRLAILLIATLVGARLAAQRYTWTNFVGQPGTSGTADGTGRAARFYNPVGVAVDSAGAVYVADSGNSTVRKVTAAGVVTTLAGSARSPGANDGTGSAARFRWPAGMAVDSSGTIYLADADLRTIRSVSALGVVTTLAGSSGMIGSADGTGNAARFNNPFGLALDRAGYLYVADTYNRTIRRVTTVGAVTTLAGLASSSGSADGTGSVARFYDPLGVAVDSAGTLYVADSTNHTLRKVTAAGVVTTLAGLAGSAGSADGAGSSARFNLPFGVAADATGNLYVADARNYTIRKVTAAGVVTTIGGTAGSSGTADGSDSLARFGSPYGIAVDRAGILYVADAANHRISRGVPIAVPTVTEVTSTTPDGTWGIGASIAITVTFSKPVLVSGTPQLTLETGPSAALANYTGGSGTSTLTFSYTVAAGHTTLDLDYVGTTALALHGGAIRDSAGNAAILALPTPGTTHSLSANKALVVDGIAPTLLLSSTAPEPTNLIPIPVTATFSKPVSGFDANDLVVTNGTVGAFAGSAAGYSFTVTAVGQGPVTVTVAAGACVSAAGNPNRAATPLSRTFDSVSPTVDDVSSPARNGIYGPGAVLAIRLTFSEPVSVTGAPQVVLETGETDAAATYAGGSGTTTLTCLYTVAAGDLSVDLDYVGTSALEPRGGTIRDAAGNAAVLTLTTPGTAHSLGANQALVLAAVGAPNGPFLAQVTAPAVASGRGLWNLTGSYATTLDSHDLALNLVHDIRGRLTGVATLRVDTGSAVVPVTMSAKGGVKGDGTALTLALRLRGTDTQRQVAASLSLNLFLDAAARQLRGPVTGSLEVNGVMTPVAGIVTLALRPSMDGTWSLLFELQQNPRGIGGTATLSLSNGVEYRSQVSGRTVGSAAVLNLTGLPANRPAAGTRMRATIDTLGGALTELAGFVGKAYGQTLAW